MIRTRKTSLTSCLSFSPIGALPLSHHLRPNQTPLNSSSCEAVAGGPMASRINSSSDETPAGFHSGFAPPSLPALSSLNICPQDVAAIEQNIRQILLALAGAGPMATSGDGVALCGELVHLGPLHRRGAVRQ